MCDVFFEKLFYEKIIKKFLLSFKSRFWDGFENEKHLKHNASRNRITLATNCKYACNSVVKNLQNL